MVKKIREKKKIAVDELTDALAVAQSAVFTDYRGMTVEQISALRKALREKDAAYRVVKNRFARLALHQLDTEADEQLVGPTGIALVKGDEANAVAKDIFSAGTDGAPIQVKGAVLDGKFFSAEQLEALSKLPGRLELIASLMGTMKAPVQKLAATLLAYLEKQGGSMDAAPAGAEEK